MQGTNYEQQPFFSDEMSEQISQRRDLLRHSKCNSYSLTGTLEQKRRFYSLTMCVGLRIMLRSLR